MMRESLRTMPRRASDRNGTPYPGYDVLWEGEGLQHVGNRDEAMQIWCRCYWQDWRWVGWQDGVSVYRRR